VAQTKTQTTNTTHQSVQTTNLPVPADRNPGTALDLDWVQSLTINRSAVDRRADTFTKRRTVKKDHQAAYLVRAIECIDLTTLSGDDTPSNVHRLCAKAKNPLSRETLAALGLKKVHTGAVCVYHAYVADAVRNLQGSGIPVAAVSTGFPAGLSPFKQRLDEIHQSVKDGAHEIDIVITRAHALTQNWQALYDEMRAFREACGDAHVKAILATGELGTYTNVARASAVCMMAGADFIKTSTGKEPVNATLPIAFIMTRLIRDYQERTGVKIGFKPAGGIRTAKQATEYLMLMKDELGDDWLSPHLFRIGASSLLSDIERQLEHHLTGRYSAYNRHPMA
jgi:deoxyribose-phosphate aldolase